MKPRGPLASSPASALGRVLTPVVMALALLASSACGSYAPASVLQIDDLSPRQLETGDRVEISGRNLPAAADIRRISVTLRGTLARPGRAPCAGPIEVTVSDPPPGATVTNLSSGATRELTYAESTERLIVLGPDSVSFALTPELLARLLRCNDGRGEGFEAPHGTLLLGGPGPRGTPTGVIVRVDGLTGTQALEGTLRGVSMDLSAPPAQRLALEAEGQRSAERTLAFLGVTLAQSHPGDGGLRVGSVLAGSPADHAGILPLDVLLRLDGLTLLSLADFDPAPGARDVTLTVLRGDVQEDRAVSLEGLSPAAPVDVVGSAVVLAVAAVMLLFYLLPKPGVVLWLERYAAREWRRIPGPRGALVAAPPAEFVPWLASALAAAVRAPLQALASEDRAQAAAPYLLVAAVFGTAVMVPFGPSLADAGTDVTVLYAAAVVLRLARSFAGSFGPRGAPRSLLATLGASLGSALCALPAVVALACAVLLAGTPSAQGICAAQGGWPWEWTLFRTPLGIALGLLFLLSVLAVERGEDASGPSPGLAWSTVRLTLDWGNAVAMCALAAVIFLGGWRVPGIAAAEQERTALLQMLGAVIFAAKTCACVFALLWVRWALPRASGAWLLARAWGHVLALGLVTAGAAGVWLWSLPRIPATAQWAVSVATFALCALSAVPSVMRRALSAQRARSPESARLGVTGTTH